MSKLIDIVKKITQKYNIVEYEITSDQFIFEKKPKLIKDCRSCKSQMNCIVIDTTEFKCWQPIGKPEQLSGMSEKPTNHIEQVFKSKELTPEDLEMLELETDIIKMMVGKVNIKKCIICGAETIGTICEKDECFEKFEKL